MWNDDYLTQFESTDPDGNWVEDPVGFMESAKRSYDYISKTRLTRSSKPLEADIFSRNVQLSEMIESGMIDARPFYQEPSDVSRLSVGLDHYDFDGLAEFAQSMGHEIETTKQITDRYRVDALSSQLAFEESDSILGTLVGGIGAEFTDPVMLASMFTGIGSVRNMRTMARLGTLAVENVATEAITIPDKAAYADNIDQEYGANEAATDLLVAAALPIALDTGVRAVGAALKAVNPHSKQVNDIADSLIDAPEDRTVVEHLQAKEQAIENVENPKSRIDEEETEPLHMQDDEIDEFFDPLDDAEAKAAVKQLDDDAEYAEILEACLTGRT